MEQFQAGFAFSFYHSYAKGVRENEKKVEHILSIVLQHFTNQ